MTRAYRERCRASSCQLDLSGQPRRCRGNGATCATESTSPHTFETLLSPFLIIFHSLQLNINQPTKDPIIPTRGSRGGSTPSPSNQKKIPCRPVPFSPPVNFQALSLSSREPTGKPRRSLACRGVLLQVVVYVSRRRRREQTEARLELTAHICVCK